MKAHGAKRPGRMMRPEVGLAPGGGCEKKTTKTTGRNRK